MKPPIELSRPTALNIAAIICYCLAMLFNIIAYATANWSSLLLEGVRWRMGLWYGCREYSNGTEVCSTDVFNDKVFQSGMSSDWHIGSQVMMTLALITLFLLEFAVIGYACIKCLERYKAKVVGLILGLSVTSAFCHFLTLIMYGTEVEKVPESSIQASFGIIILCLFLELAIPVLVLIDKSRRFPKSNVFIETGRGKSKSSSGPKVSAHPSGPNSARPFTISGHSKPSNMAPASIRTSVSSLTETETFRKFAYLEESTNSIGSSRSLRTEGTAYTNLSYSHDRASIESEL